MKHISDLTKKELFEQALKFKIDTRDLSLSQIRKKVIDKKVEIEVEHFLNTKDFTYHNFRR